MPIDKKHRIPLEDWSNYLDVPETSPEEMTVKELIALANKIRKELDYVESLIEERSETETTTEEEE